MRLNTTYLSSVRDTLRHVHRGRGACRTLWYGGGGEGVLDTLTLGVAGHAGLELPQKRMMDSISTSPTGAM